MIKTEKITIAPIKQYVKEIKIYVCDICGRDSQKPMYTCYLCERHVCSRNLSEKSCRKTDPDDCGDYPGSLCPICYELKAGKYGKEIKDLREKCDADEEAILQKIIKKSLATVI